ncbi:MAG: hypothetical protein O7G87_09360 [bacterium]|nr:hypothetical protein [bacterium]
MDQNEENNGNDLEENGNDLEENGNGKKNIVLIVGAVAVVLAIIIYIVMMPEKGPEVDPYVTQLEQEVATYTAQIDSINNVVLGLNTRIDEVRTQMDSSRASNRLLLASLHRVTGEMQEYRRLYSEQKNLSTKLRNELKRVKAEKEQAGTEVKELKSQMDDLNNQLYDQTIRLTRMESSLEEALEKSDVLEETVHSVLVYIGTEDELKQQRYLKTGRAAIFSKSYKVIGFPDISGSNVMKISVGETLTLQGELQALCDRHGKLGKGKEYEISKGPPGQTLISFSDQTLAGQRVLAVLKK